MEGESHVKSIYQSAVELIDAKDIDHHESDLYLRKNEVSQQLVEQYENKDYVLTFIDEIDGQWWYEIPFAYEPYWLSIFEQVRKGATNQ